MKVILSFCTAILLSATAQAGVVIDDFTVYPAGDSALTFSAPNLGKNPTFQRHFGLDPKHVLGGTRAASLNGYSAIAVEMAFVHENNFCRITFPKLCTGTASLSYKGGDMGEALDLDKNLKEGGAQGIYVHFDNAPSAGTLAVTAYSGDKIETVNLPIKAGSPSVFPFANFKQIDFAHIDGLTLEIQIPREINKNLVYNITKIETLPLGKK